MCKVCPEVAVLADSILQCRPAAELRVPIAGGDAGGDAGGGAAFDASAAVPVSRNLVQTLAALTPNSAFAAP